MSGFERAALLCLALSAAPAGAERVALHWLWHEGEHDSAYVLAGDIDPALSHRGYRDMGAIALVDTGPAAGTLPLRCYYAGPPQTNTFCSISTGEQRRVQRLGYTPVRTAGHVLRSAAPGALPLYRVSRAFGDGSDREHRFVVGDAALAALRKDLWIFDGTKGYVFPAAP